MCKWKTAVLPSGLLAAYKPGGKASNGPVATESDHPRVHPPAEAANRTSSGQLPCKRNRVLVPRQRNKQRSSGHSAHVENDVGAMGFAWAAHQTWALSMHRPNHLTHIGCRGN